MAVSPEHAGVRVAGVAIAVGGDVSWCFREKQFQPPSQ